MGMDLGLPWACFGFALACLARSGLLTYRSGCVLGWVGLALGWVGFAWVCVGVGWISFGMALGSAWRLPWNEKRKAETCFYKQLRVWRDAPHPRQHVENGSMFSETV